MLVVLCTGSESRNVDRFSLPVKGRVSATFPADLSSLEASSVPFPGEEIGKGER